MPRYLELAEELRDEIMARAYSDGGQFPTETALCERFGVSRFTVREALKRLQAEGLIARKRGSGTVVQPAAARGGALHQPLSNVGELLQYARDSAVNYAEQPCDGLPDKIAKHIGEDLTGAWRCFRGIRRHADDERPIAVTDAYFHGRLGDAIDQLDLSAGTLFSQLTRLAGLSVSRVTQDIQAVAAGPNTCRALEINEGDPVLRITRCYIDAKARVFEISVSHHPGDRFAYAMHIDLDD